MTDNVASPTEIRECDELISHYTCILQNGRQKRSSMTCKNDGDDVDLLIQSMITNKRITFPISSLSDSNGKEMSEIPEMSDVEMGAVNAHPSTC